MSLLARVVVASFAGLLGLAMIRIGMSAGKGVFHYAFGAFCFAIALACVTRGRVARFIGSAVGVTVVGSCLWYVVSAALDVQAGSGRESGPSLIKALALMLIIGLPAGIYVYHARFGLGKTASADSPEGEEAPHA